MDQIAAALVKLIEAGAPLASYALVLHYATTLSAQILTAGTIITVVYLVYKLIRYGIENGNV